MRTRSYVTLAVMVALALGAASCGGSSSSSSSGSAGGGSTPEVLSGGGNSGSLGGSAAGGSGFCADAQGKLQQMEAKLAQIATLSTQKDQLKQELQTWQSYTQSAEADAPSQIKGDVAVIVGFINHLSEGYAKAGYDPIKAAAVLGPYLQENQAKLQAAGDHIQAWAQTNCGL
jgi:hypothetical protein